MKDILSDLVTMDIRLVGNDIAVGEDDSTLGRAGWCAVNTMRGTFGWDLDYGVDWAGVLTSRGGVDAKIAGAVREAVRALGIARVKSVVIDRTTRIATVKVDIAGASSVYSVYTGG
jgi:hypothetical protein